MFSYLNADECIVRQGGASGVCKAIEDCPNNIDEILNVNLYPVSCGAVENVRISKHRHQNHSVNYELVNEASRLKLIQLYLLQLIIFFFK